MTVDVEAVEWPITHGPVRSWARDGYSTGAHVQAAATARARGVVHPVAVMPDAHVGIGACVGTVVATEGTIIPACVGVDIGCFVGETRVPLLDGTQRTLRSLAEGGGEFWVYSIDVDTMDIAPGRATAMMTRQSADLVRVVVAGGDEIVCTPDHEFMLRDGSWRRAEDLSFNDSLMPLYRSWQARDGYEAANRGNRGTKRPQLTHRRVFEALHGPVPGGMVVHHANGNHFDNRPENLELMDVRDHSAHHRRAGHSFANDDPEFQAKHLRGISESVARPERQAQMAEVGRRNIVGYMESRPEHFKESVAGNGARGAPVLRRFNTTPRDCDECDHTAVNPAALRWHKQRVHQTNHKVLSVESLAQKADVYCLHVEKHHNFALAAGVFVHNCGMSAVRLALSADQLPDDLSPVLDAWARAVPPTRHPHGVAPIAGRAALATLGDSPSGLADMGRAAVQLGTLGSGNHFLELSLDRQGRVWVVVHSGSRGVGNYLARQHIRAASKLDAEAPSKDLAALDAGTAEFDAYVGDMLWAQRYAYANREAMLEAARNALANTLGLSSREYRIADRVRCHHNYAEPEIHDGREVWVTRKGAIRAQAGDRGIIPGSMGASTFLVEGLGNSDSYCSASHGAGRTMSRRKAKEALSVDEMREQMAGRVWLEDKASTLLDEAPDAYKPIAEVMRWQSDLCRVADELTAVVNYKGT